MKDQELQKVIIKITAEEGRVVIEFSKALKWIKLDKESVLQFAGALVTSANEIKEATKQCH